MSPDDVSKVLDELGHRFGATGAGLWREYWHATMVFAVTCMTISVAFGCLSLWAASKIRIGDRDFQWVRGTLMLLSVLIAALGVACNLTDIVTPQGVALHSLLDRAR